MATLEHAAIDEHTLASALQQMAGTGNVAIRAVKR
jgi:hypothetical protein